MKIKKIKIKGTDVYLAWEDRNEANAVIESSMTSKEPGRPELYQALAALAPDVIKMCELPEDYLDRITVRSVSFSYGGPDGTMGATISAGMHLEESYQDLNLNTPHKASAMYNPDTPDDEMQLLSSDCIERLEALQEECEAYIKGDRAQGSLFSVA